MTSVFAEFEEVGLDPLDHHAVKTVSLNDKHRVLTIVLAENATSSSERDPNLKMTLVAKKNGTVVNHEFVVIANTTGHVRVSKDEQTLLEDDDLGAEHDGQLPFDVEEEEEGKGHNEVDLSQVDEKEFNMTKEDERFLRILKHQLTNEELTLKGFHVKRNHLLRSYARQHLIKGGNLEQIKTLKGAENGSGLKPPQNESILSRGSRESDIFGGRLPKEPSQEDDKPLLPGNPAPEAKIESMVNEDEKKIQGNEMAKEVAHKISRSSEKKEQEAQVKREKDKKIQNRAIDLERKIVNEDKEKRADEVAQVPKPVKINDYDEEADEEEVDAKKRKLLALDLDPVDYEFMDEYQRKTRRKRMAAERDDEIEMPRRKLLDSYSESLLHVQRVFSDVYGHAQRRVPAHIPHFVDRSILDDLHQAFREEFDRTSASRFRAPSDMQFSFAYYHFLMNERTPFSARQVFNDFDTDNSGT